ncbi:MAG: hypothetical protein C4309_14310 [Chloroflexota bacterium]
MFTCPFSSKGWLACIAILAISLSTALPAAAAQTDEPDWEPTTIRVWVTRLPGSPIHTVDFRTTYIHRVLVGELGGPCTWDCTTDWPADAVRAMAVVIRSLGWYYLNHPLSGSYDVTDLNPQFYDEGHDQYIRAVYRDATDYTKSVIAVYNDETNPLDPLWAGHYARTGNPTTDYNETGPNWPCNGDYPGGDRRGSPYNRYLLTTQNSVDSARLCPESGGYYYVGMGQISSGHWAAGTYTTPYAPGAHWPQLLSQFFARGILQQAIRFDNAQYAYYNGGNGGTCGATILYRTDYMLNFDWGSNSPAPGVPADNFCVTWSKDWTVPRTGWYTFQVKVDDGVRLYVNNILLINAWYDQAPMFYSASIYLYANTVVPVRMEYYEHTGGAVAKLTWIYGKGLIGEYHNNSTDPYTSPIAYRRADPDVYFNWYIGKPEARTLGPNQGTDQFSVHWVGWMWSYWQGNHQFIVRSDDGVRVLLNGTPIIDRWNDHAPTVDAAYPYLYANTLYRIEVYYYENSGWAVMQLEWN